MRRDFERRLRRLEMASSRRTLEIWFEEYDGTFRGPEGERITREAFFRLHPPGSSGVFVFKPGDEGI